MLMEAMVALFGEPGITKLLEEVTSNNPVKHVKSLTENRNYYESSPLHGNLATSKKLPGIMSLRAVT